MRFGRDKIERSFLGHSACSEVATDATGVTRTSPVREWLGAQHPQPRCSVVTSGFKMTRRNERISVRRLRASRSPARTRKLNARLSARRESMATTSYRMTCGDVAHSPGLTTRETKVTTTGVASSVEGDETANGFASKPSRVQKKRTFRPGCVNLSVKRTHGSAQEIVG